MVSENITRRYNFTFSELEKKIDVKGSIDRVEPVTEYQKQNDVSLKEVDVIVTTIELIEPEFDENGIPIKKNKQA